MNFVKKLNNSFLKLFFILLQLLLHFFTTFQIIFSLNKKIFNNFYKIIFLKFFLFLDYF